MIDKTKAAIKDYSVFDGLCVQDTDYYAQKFLQDGFHLFEHDQSGVKGYVVFQVKGESFIFHLVNFTNFKTKSMTQDFINFFVKPYCEKNDIKTIYATAERLGMAIKLKKLGFNWAAGSLYRRDVKHVF